MGGGFRKWGACGSRPSSTVLSAVLEDLHRRHPESQSSSHVLIMQTDSI
jgi:hypothetical protein